MHDIGDRGACARDDRLRSTASSNPLYRCAFEDAPTALVLWSPEGSFLDANRRARAYLGYGPDDHVTGDWRRSCHPQDIADLELGALRVLQGAGTYFTDTLRLLHKAGHWIPTVILLTSTGGEGRQTLVAELTHGDGRRPEDDRDDLMRDVVETADTIILAVTGDAEIIYANPSAGRALRYTVRELRTLRIPDIDPGYPLPEAKAKLQEVLQAGGGSLRTTFRRKDGSVFPVHVTFSTTFVEHRTQGVLLCLIQDRTETREIERALRFTRFAMDRASDMALWTDRTGRLVYANEAIRRASGYTRDELLNLRIHELDPAMSTETWDGFWAGLKERGSGSFESLLITKEGGRIPVEISADFVEFEGREYICALGRDITEWKRFERELLEREERLQILFEYAPDAFYILDQEGRLVDANRAAERLTGLDRADVLGQSFINWGVLPPEEHERALNLLRRNSRGEPTGPDELILRPADGSRRSVEVRTYPVKIQGQTRVLGIARDITKRRAAEERARLLNEELEDRVRERTAEAEEARREAEKANRAKSVFLAKMSHEIRTPMNAVLGFTQLMSRESDLSPTQSRYIKTVLKSGEHLLSLIEDILEVAKIESGRAVFQPHVFDLQTLLDGVAGLFQIRVASQGLQLKVVRGAECPRHVFGDEQKTRQVLTNLVGNAVKFTGQGRIVLQARMEIRGQGAQWLLVDVADTGIGIARADQERIFGQFEQVDTQETVQRGTGLGLTISREYARVMGGDLTVRSEPGKGSIFRLEVPVQEREGRESLSPAPERRVVGIKPGQPPLRILIADDDSASRDLSRQLLESVGFETVTAKNGRECLDIAAEWSPDVVLMDVVMPELDGYTAASRINSDPALSGTKIIIQSASSISDREEWDRRRGVDAFLRKPIQEALLFDTLARLTGVEFVYRSIPSDPAEPVPDDGGAVRRILPELPDSLRQDLVQAALRCDIGRLEECASQVAPYSQPAAEALRSLSARYEFDVLAGLLNESGVPA